MESYSKKKPSANHSLGFFDSMPDNVLLSHGNPHTTIGAKQFHFWVRDGIRWYLLAIVIRQTGCLVSFRDPVENSKTYKAIVINNDTHWSFDTDTTLTCLWMRYLEHLKMGVFHTNSNDCNSIIYLTISRSYPIRLSQFTSRELLKLYDQASRAISTG